MSFLQSITSLFGRPTRNTDSFSLPTTNYENTIADGSPGPSRRGSYQPTAGGETVTGHDSYLMSKSAAGRYPPVSHTFHRLRNALADTFPELIDTINNPVLADALASFEQQVGSPLPPPVRESFLVADGQDLDTLTCGGLYYGLYLLPLEEVLNEWMFWRQVEQDPRTSANPAILATMASIPPQWIKLQYTSPGWIPLISDRAGNYIGVDLDPGEGGTWGQVIIFGRDFDRKCVLWRGDGEGAWGKWLASFVDEIESGEAWEADKASSDDEEQLGYTSYSSSDVYGEGGQVLRLSGEYKGWSVLEAAWDKSVKKWDGLGLGMDVAQIQRGLEEARRLNSSVKGKGKEREEPATARESIDFEGIRSDQRMAQNDIPSLTASNTDGRTTPVEGDALLPPASPESQSVPRILHPHHSPSSRSAASDHPLRNSELLRPPGRKMPRVSRNRPLPPAPAMLDLPTRADVQAAEAVAHAETSGLRGGWIMNLDTSVGAAQRRSHAVSPSMAAMEDIDLEDGRQEAYGTPPMRPEDLARQRVEDRLAYAGIEHRRSPALSQPNSLPLSRTSSSTSATPRESAYVTPTGGTPPVGAIPSVGSSIRRPPPIVDNARAHSPVSGDSQTGEVIRGVSARRPSATGASSQVPRKDSLTTDPRQRENSAISTDSAEALLLGDTQGSNPGTGAKMSTVNGPAASRIIMDEPVSVGNLTTELEEIKL